MHSVACDEAPVKEGEHRARGGEGEVETVRLRVAGVVGMGCAGE